LKKDARKKQLLIEKKKAKRERITMTPTQKRKRINIFHEKNNREDN
jgi:hypothetical protein